ncbi:S8 family serine peptidase [Myxococcus sp. CA040A]|uniref:S8 family serine peptidase n=1 Tax=Myxococcus sp. CA040A TaxID=2741738 RepID=UPI001C2D06AA|nr:S8 family serine peptidase [Myxococcus sp. CA040A]
MPSSRLLRCLQACLFLALGAHCGEPPASPTEASPPPASLSKLEEEPTTRPRFVPGRVLVKFRPAPQGKASSVSAPMTLHGLTFQQADVLSGGTELWTLASNEALTNKSVAEQESLTTAAVEELRLRSDVEYAHVDPYMDYLSEPVDPYYGLQWHYPAIHLPEAWQTVTGNVKIAVLDSGRLAHPDLDDRWGPGHDFGYEQPNVSDPDPTSDGRWHHGLAVAGILGAKWDNYGVAGVCRDCPLMPVKISSTADRPIMSNVTKAINWAVLNGAKVINMSFGTLEPTEERCVDFPLLQQAVTNAIQAGVVVVAAAGNDNRDPSVVIPASCQGVITVAATMPNGHLAPYSNRGPRVTITAPGGGPDVYGNGLLCDDPTPMGPYNGLGGSVTAWAVSKPGPTVFGADFCHRYISGTSFAAPHVAGVAALIMTQRPHWTVAQVTQRLLQSVNAVPGCPANTCGAGMLDASKAVITPLLISSPTCESIPGTATNTSTFSCTVPWPFGGVTPYTQSWSSIANLTIENSTSISVAGTCTPGTDATVRFTVSDSEATTLSRDVSFRCATPALDARIVFQRVDSNMQADRIYNITVMMQNTGTEPWTAATGFRLQAVEPVNNTSFWGLDRVQLEPGEVIRRFETKTFLFAIRTPYELGTYPFQWRMMKEGHGLFGAPSFLTQINVTVPFRDSAFVRQSVPTSVVAGSTFHATFTMKNTGSDIWTMATFYRLGSQPATSSVWGHQRIYLNPTDSAARGQDLTFSTMLTAPTTPGPYTMYWRMVQDGFDTPVYFGAFTEPITINVTLPPRDAVVVSQSGPTTVMAGTSFVYDVTLRNTGTLPWRADTGFSLRNLFPEWSNSNGALAPGEEVAPGAEKTFHVTVNAPTQVRSYALRWQMWQTQAGGFGQSSPLTFIQVIPRTDATFVGQTVPARVEPGQSFPVTVTMKNSGDTTWGDSAIVHLAPLPNLQGNNWGHVSVTLEPGDRVKPGDERTFSFTATAPTTTQGPHAFQWRMRMQTAPGTFSHMGESSALVNILVADRCYCPPGDVCQDVNCTPPVKM